MTAPQSALPHFFIYDEEAKAAAAPPAPPAGALTPLEQLLTTPIELTHSYLYAQLLPHLLALRLNVLKRLLEILKDRPLLIQLLPDTDDGDTLPPLLPTLSNLSGQLMRTLLFRSRNHSQDGLGPPSPTLAPKVALPGLTAALTALFRPPMRRLGLFPVEVLSTPAKPKPGPRAVSASHYQGELGELMLMIAADLDLLMKNQEVAEQLHDLSLSKDTQLLDNQAAIKHKLLYALATPFVEHPLNMAALLAAEQGPPKLPQFHPLLVALASLNQPAGGPVAPAAMALRPFHALAKRNNPQLVFTIANDNPWLVIVANDLACLMFGVSQLQIKALTLMDLIAPQFRDFVTLRLNRYHPGNRRLKMDVVELARQDILFAGEIVAILRPGARNFAYTLLWAKRKGLFIICMFDQIPCDAFDVVATTATAQVAQVVPICGDLVLLRRQFALVGEMLPKLAAALETAPDSELALELVNKTRYYTLRLESGDNLPCAVTLNPVESDNNIKLKIHALPYIAGMFVVDLEFHILSGNNAIAKNLFGRPAPWLKGQLIDVLLPDFTRIVQFGIDHTQLRITPGLVFPEHFFRKYDAVLRSLVLEEPTLPEELFFASPGIAGVHADGSQIYVDVQLRALSQEAFTVWVTFLRPSGHIVGSGPAAAAPEPQTNKPEPEDPAPPPQPLPASLKRRPGLEQLIHKRTLTFDPLGGVPLQKQLSPDSEDAAFDPPQLKRNSSVRKPKAGTFAFPVRFLSGNKLSNLFSKEKEAPTDPTVPGTVLSGTQEGPTPPPQLAVDTSFHNYTEAEILELETKQLALLMAELQLWPREVGHTRRTKKFALFVVEKEMGEGAYGKVVLAHHKEDPKYRIIIKCIDKERILVDTWVRDRKLGTIPLEIQIMYTLNAEPHPNIMKIVDFFEDRQYYYLETPIFGDPPAIDLFDYIEVKNDMSEDECRFIFRQVCLAIYHLHKHGIVHRDIKDENVIVDENGIIKLIDFGSAGYTKQGPFDVFVGTIDYALPEVLRGDKYDGRPQDIWALGILLYTMLYKENPFYNVDEIMEGDLRVPYVISDASIALIKRILVRDVASRPSITDIVEDEWLQF